MKKIISSLLVGVVVVGLAGCSTSEKIEQVTSEASQEETTSTAEETTEETTTETTTVETTTEALSERNLEKVAKAMIDAMGDDYYIFETSDPESDMYLGDYTADDNEAVGILDTIYLGAYMFDDNADEADSPTITWVTYIIFEYDVESAEYKELSVGNELNYYDVMGDGDTWGSEETSDIVTAINGPYVLVGSVFYGLESETYPESFEHVAPFSVETAQAGYDAFIAYE